jgi:hypothetical protein
MSGLRKWSGVAAVVAWTMALSAGVLGGCDPVKPADGPQGKATGTAKAVDPPATTGSAVVSGKPFDQCDSSPPLAIKYSGLLKEARCDYDRFPIMAGISTMLGCKCNHCHAPDPNNAREELYPVMTPKKEIANWMKNHLMKAIKPADGSEMKCSSCHLDEQGKPTPKILKTQRDTSYAHEWMSLVMTTKFVVAATGEKLKCKSCHVGNFGTSDWQAKVILTDHIPAH